MMIYKVTWEERDKLKCSCCTENKHSWLARESELTTNKAVADSIYENLCDIYNNTNYPKQVRAMDKLAIEVTNADWESV